MQRRIVGFAADAGGQARDAPNLGALPSGSTVPQFKVLVIGDPQTLLETTRLAWQAAEIMLEGPTAPDAIELGRARDWAGVLVDIALVDDRLIDLLDAFEELRLPYIFIVVDTLLPSEDPRPYILSPDPADIQALLQALLNEGRKGPNGMLSGSHS
ncbi:hypothetical protein ASG25_17185 [Rhizobium sp. Leaf384]|uniref:hypothetical protein n=1 Tax=unclassified Rhizobium TaxID=2613769 RepID=UPI0007140F3F|nr:MULTISPECIES: hypothetical protein [unclassified Rhizobium]KQS77110.1 hypothetical protein ASG25_17185 [Rhizobium sp. Leaf384]KQS78381.1 hypothetical protein ASG58_08400 [Rhizobium sp. Leaf383]